MFSFPDLTNTEEKAQTLSVKLPFEKTTNPVMS